MLKLAVFDLDGTLKEAPDPYVYLHERLGTLEATGTPRSVLMRHLNDNPYLPGARETIAALKDRGLVVAIISSGLLLHAQMVAEELGIGPVVGNEIFFEGEEADPLVSGRVRTHCAYGAKRPILEQMQAQLGVTAAETLAAGDSGSDLGLFEAAAVRVAVKPTHRRIAATADIVLDDGNLTPLLDRLRSYAPHLW